MVPWLASVATLDRAYLKLLTRLCPIRLADRHILLYMELAIGVNDVEDNFTE
jgi:hypothetical protein